MASYAGSPALSPEARDKVLQTFRHTLSLAQSGKADEALLGCDFILKMDGRFAPARALLDALRTAAPGAPVDVDRFSEFLGFDSAVEEISSAADVPAVPKAAAPAAAAPPPLGDAFPAPAAAAAGASLEDLVFGACAIVADREVVFGMARMFEVLARGHFAAIRTFRREADGEQWLDSGSGL